MDMKQSMRVLPLSLSFLFLQATSSEALQITDDSTSATNAPRPTSQALQRARTMNVGVRKDEFDTYLARVDFIKAVDFDKSNVTFSFLHNYMNGKSDQTQKVAMPMASKTQIGFVDPALYARWQKGIKNVNWSGSNMVFTDFDNHTTSLQAVEEITMNGPSGAGAIKNFTVRQSGGRYTITANNCDCGIQSVTRSGMSLNFKSINGKTTTQKAVEKVTMQAPSGTGGIKSFTVTESGSGYNIKANNCDCGIVSVGRSGLQLTFRDIKGSTTTATAIGSISASGGGSPNMTSISVSQSGDGYRISASGGECHCTYCKHCSYCTHCAQCACQCPYDCNCRCSTECACACYNCDCASSDDGG